ncbi:MAG: hypothetical protein WKF80_12550, partial [Thermomicrobiales bacterium]
MAIAFDAASSANSPSTATSLTWAHTVGSGSDRLLIVGITTSNYASAACTYGGVEMTQAGVGQNGAALAAALFFLVNPPVGTAQVVFTNATRTRIVGGATSWTGVDQTSPLGTLASATGTSTVPSVVVASATGEIVHDAVGGQASSNTPFTVGAGQTARWNLNPLIGTTYSPGAGSTEPGATSVTMSWSRGVSEAWAIIAVPIKPVPTGVFIGGSAAGTSATSGTVTQGRPIAGSATGLSLTSGWLARYPAEAETVRFRGGPKRLARSMWRATVDNVRVEDITAKVTGASVSMDIDRTILSTLSVDLIDPSVVRPYSDYLAPTVTITEIVSGVEVTSQLGLYRAGLPSVTRHPKAVVGTVGGEDIVSLLVNSGTGAAPYNLAPGANYMAAAVSQCNLAGVTRVRFPADARTVATGKFHSWPPGTARCRIVLDIMLILGYLP